MIAIRSGKRNPARVGYRAAPRAPRMLCDRGVGALRPSLVDFFGRRSYEVTLREEMR